MTTKNQTRFNQSIFVNGDVELSGNIFAPNGDIFLGGTGGVGVSDSIFKCSATFTTNPSNLSNTLTDVEFTSKFKVGDTVRIYGASDQDTVNMITSSLVSVSATASTPVVPVTATPFYYCVSEFNLDTGEISPASVENVVNVGFDIETFGMDQFVTLAISNITGGRGVLLYRKIGSAGNWKLISVLSPKDLASDYIDYYLYDQTEWSGKDNDNALPSDIIHFPQTPPTVGLRGWADNVIVSTNNDDNIIVLENQLIVDPLKLTVNISHNDTSYIQNMLDNVSNSGGNNISLMDKKYVIAGIDVPFGVNIIGSSISSGFIKLPWSGAYFTTSHNNMIFSSDTSVKTAMYDIDIDGNMLNQFLAFDDSDPSRNYTINLGNSSVDFKLSNCKIKNIIGGGIYAPESDNTHIVMSEIRNSGLTDRYSYSPLNLSESSNIIINSNRIENFSDYIDAGIIYKGVITNNIIDNCGSGVFVYGSRFLITSPNILIGPAGEFLPSPDILNSSYNSVNIVLPTYSVGVVYNSDEYVYQENGEIFNLLTSNQAISTSQGNVQYEVWKLSKNKTTGAELLYGKINDINFVNNTVGIDPTQGEFKFTILTSDIQDLKTIYNYDTLVQTNANHFGLVYIAYLEEYVKAGDINTIGTVGGSNVYTVNITNAEYLYLGAKVSLSPQHTGFSVAGSDQTGIITALSTVGETTNTQITFNDVITIPPEGTTNLGYINIINKFEMAKGLIL